AEPALVRDVTNSLGMKLVLIPPGRFTRGSPNAEADRWVSEGPQREVELTEPFYLGAFEVTQAQYQRVMGRYPSWFSKEGGGKAGVAGLATGVFRVDSVSWGDAMEFCKNLSALPAEREAQRVYRLPTEAQWEYACRAGGTAATPFHFGRALSSFEANFLGEFPYGGAREGPNLGLPTRGGS